MDRERLRCFCELVRVDMVYEDEEGALTPFFDSVVDSPLMQDAALRETLQQQCAEHGSPYCHRDELRICFTVMEAEGGWLYLGPMCVGRVEPERRSAFLRQHGIAPEDTRSLRALTLRQVRNVSEVTAALVNPSVQLETEWFPLRAANVSGEQALRREQNEYLSQEEASRDEESYRHTYHEEQQVIQAIKEGRAQDAIRISRKMDEDAGFFSRIDPIHCRTLAVISITLVTRSAISAGVSPAVAYRISGYYIGKVNTTDDTEAMNHYRNRNIEDLCARVNGVLAYQESSIYTNKCRDYIQKHFREKIYLEDIAAPLGISAGYLAREFKKDTGMLIQDYVNQLRVERAANLLVYSDYTLSAIAEYVHFPTQSYFGKIFKKKKGLTPNEYRKQFRISEFWQHEGKK